MRHTISVLVENKFGVLTRIAGMFSGRGFNIDTLNVAPTLDPSTSRMTIVVTGDDTVLEQVTKQLNKLIDVIHIDDYRDEELVERELLLMRVKVDPVNRTEVMQLCDIFRAKIVDVQHEVLGIEVTGNESKIEKFLMLMGKFGISELSRTGRVALARVDQRSPVAGRGNRHPSGHTRDSRAREKLERLRRVSLCQMPSRRC